MDRSADRAPSHANLRLPAFGVWSIAVSALVMGWDLSTVDRLGRDLPDPPLGSLSMRFLIVALAIGIGAFATMRGGDESRSYLLVGTLAPIAWFVWRAQDARVSGDNFTLVGVVIILPLCFGATWVGVQQASLRIRRRNDTPAPPATPKPRTNGLGVASLVLSAFTIGTVGSVVALILGYAAVRQIDGSNGTQNGRDVAHTGVVVGLLGSAILFVDLFV